MLSRLDKGLAKGEAALTAFVLLAMIVVAAMQAILRNLADAGMASANGMLESIAWADQFLMKGTLWLAFLGASLATHDNKHIAIDILPRIATPKARATMRGIVGLAVGVVCVCYGNVIFQTIVNSAQEIPFEYAVMSDTGDMHICAAPASALMEGMVRPGLFCSVRSALAGLGVPVTTPEGTLELIVPAMFLIMSVRFFGNGVRSLMTIPHGGETEEDLHGAPPPLADGSDPAEVGEADDAEADADQESDEESDEESAEESDDDANASGDDPSQGDDAGDSDGDDDTNNSPEAV